MLRRPPFSGMGWLYASAALFASVNLLVRLAAPLIGAAAVSGFRFVLGIGLSLAAIKATGAPFRPVRPGIVAARGLAGALSMTLGYVALGISGGAGRATLLGNTYPVFTALIAAAFYRERLRWPTLLALGSCVAGSLLVLGDGSGSSLAGDLCALASAVVSGLGVNLVRQAAGEESPFMLYLSPCLFGLPLVIVLGATGMIPAPATASFSGIGWALAGAVALLSFGGQIFMARGYRDVPAGRGSVVFYLETGLTMAGGLALGERMNLKFGLGLLLIVCGLVLNQRPAPRPPQHSNNS